MRSPVLAIALTSVGMLCHGQQRDMEDAITDIDGNAYHAVSIGSQVWMAENLAVTRYRDGSKIPPVPDEERWSRSETGAYCSSALSGDHRPGLLYNFHAVNDERGLCPDGWHVPTAAEWRTLIDHLGGVEVAGGKMKSTAPGLWRTPVPGTSNVSGFSAVPAGGRGRLGDAGDAGYFATWWSSTSDDTDYAWHWGLHPDGHGIRFNPGHKASGFSVRCIQD